MAVAPFLVGDRWFPQLRRNAKTFEILAQETSFAINGLAGFGRSCPLWLRGEAIIGVNFRAQVPSFFCRVAALRSMKMAWFPSLGKEGGQQPAAAVGVVRKPLESPKSQRWGRVRNHPRWAYGPASPPQRRRGAYFQESRACRGVAQQRMKMVDKLSPMTRGTPRLLRQGV